MLQAHAGRPGSPAFLSHVHSLRGLAILAVVSVHVAEAAGWSHSRVFSEQALYSLFGNATVLFVFVSGFLFQHLSVRFQYLPYLKKRLATVVVPYLVVSTPTLIRQYLAHSGVYEGAVHRNPIAIAARACLTGAQMPIPLWYVPMIVLFFLAAPLLLFFQGRVRLHWVIIPALLLATFLHRSREHRVVWQSALYFLPAYLTGMWASLHREQVLTFVHRHRWSILMATTGLFLIEIGPLHHHGGPIYSLDPFSTEAGWVDLDLTTKLLLTFLLLYWLRQHDRMVRGWFSGFANASFGVFFLHGYVILICQAIIHRSFRGGSHLGLAGYLLATVIVAATSIGGAWLIQRLLGSRSQFVIGCRRMIPGPAAAVGTLQPANRIPQRE